MCDKSPNKKHQFQGGHGLYYCRYCDEKWSREPPEDRQTEKKERPPLGILANMYSGGEKDNPINQKNLGGLDRPQPLGDSKPPEFESYTILEEDDEKRVIQCNKPKPPEPREDDEERSK